MNARYYILTVIGLILMLFTNACKKSSFLDANPNEALIVPKTIGQYQAILDNYTQMNESTPTLGERSSDDYYIQPGFFETLPQQNRNVYVWNDDMWFNGSTLPSEWNVPYNVIFNANLVLNGLKDIKVNSAEQVAWNNLKGHALFLRAFYFYQLSQLFIPVYTASSASSQLGLPLRLGINLDEPIRRSTIKATYDQMIQDLDEAKNLLQDQATIKTRPSKHAVYALLSRIYLLMGEYGNSLQNANACLAIKNTLLDYNLPDILSKSMEEIIWPATMGQVGFLPSSEYEQVTVVDTNLLALYHQNDKRTTVFFADNGLGGKYFKGQYDIIQPTSSNLFSGLATDEIYLIRAECNARLGNKDLAINDLNALIIKRWANDGSWVPFTAATTDEALDKVLKERRKELVFRGLRWSDLRRLNWEGRNITLKRKMDDGTIVTLASNSLHYTHLIPPSVMGFHPEMSQNLR